MAEWGELSEESHSLMNRTRDLRWGAGAGEPGVSGDIIIESKSSIELPFLRESCSSLVEDISLVASEIWEQVDVVRDRLARKDTRSEDSMGEALTHISSLPFATVTEPAGLCCKKII